jgi:hypothetical protein
MPLARLPRPLLSAPRLTLGREVRANPSISPDLTFRLVGHHDRTRQRSRIHATIRPKGVPVFPPSPRPWKSTDHDPIASPWGRSNKTTHLHTVVQHKKTNPHTTQSQCKLKNATCHMPATASAIPPAAHARSRSESQPKHLTRPHIPLSWTP